LPKNANKFELMIDFRFIPEGKSHIIFQVPQATSTIWLDITITLKVSLNDYHTDAPSFQAENEPGEVLM
jgi:hypothetical protein